MKLFLAVCLLVLMSDIVLSQNYESAKGDSSKVIFNANLNKNDYFIGGTLSLNSKEIQNRNALLVNIDDQTSNAVSFAIDGGYALKDNFFIGMGIEYGQTNKKGNYTESDLQKFTKYFNNQIEFRPFIKNYVPLDINRRFNIITQTQLSFSFDQTLSESVVENDIQRTFTRKFQAGIGIRPGISVFVIRNFAIETTVNVAGIRYTYQKSETTNLQPTIVKQGLIDLKIDIIQLNLGFFVYF